MADPLYRRPSQDPQTTFRADASLTPTSPMGMRKGSDLTWKGSQQGSQQVNPEKEREQQSKGPSIGGFKIRIPLAVLFVVSMLSIAAGLSVAIGVISIVKGDQSVAETAGHLIEMTANRAVDRTNMMLSSARSLLYTTANSTLMWNFFNGDTQSNVLARHLLDPAYKDVITLHYNVAKQNTFLSASGFYFEGNNNYMAAYAPASFIAVEDETTRSLGTGINGYTGARCNGTGTPYNFTQPSGKVVTMTGNCIINSTGVSGFDIDGSLKFNPGLPFRGDWDLSRLWSTVYNSNGSPVWAPMTYSNNPMLMTFLVPLIQPLWYGQATGVKGSGTFFAAQFVTMTLNSLENYLPTIKPTTNAVISFIDTTGRLIASSEPGATANLTTGTRYFAYASTNPTIASTGQYLLPDYATQSPADLSAAVLAIPDDHSTEFTGPNGVKYLLRTHWISDPYGLKWLMLLTIPRADFYSKVDQAKKSVVGVSVGLGITSFFASLIIAYVVILPIKRLNRVMNEATNFDFSALRTGYLERRSIFGEIAEMQGVFASMMTKFATAIQNNKRLVQRGGGGSLGQGSSVQNVGVVTQVAQVKDSRPMV
ncbi:hypothetical protein HDV00_006694, partial [Rhizophlyctis rosea]